MVVFKNQEPFSWHKDCMLCTMLAGNRTKRGMTCRRSSHCNHSSAGKVLSRPIVHTVPFNVGCQSQDLTMMHGLKAMSNFPSIRGVYVRRDGMPPIRSHI